MTERAKVPMTIICAVADDGSYFAIGGNLKWEEKNPTYQEIHAMIAEAFAGHHPVRVFEIHREELGPEIAVIEETPDEE